MPPSRLHVRYSIGRRPSVFASLASELIKPGIYGASPSPRSVTFAPNVTPYTYKDADELVLDGAEDLALPIDAQLFPPSEEPLNPVSKRRAPPGKRRSLGYIPRPPNAFMLFRADFVRQKHVPGSIETNHGSLSKIIGNCWRALPLEEKRIWEIKAKQEKEAHSKKYPGYRFRPVHNKDKAKKKEKAPATPEDERRCEEVAQLLLEGKKGDELAAAIRRLDEKKVATPVPQLAQTHAFYPPRRPSSVPLPDSRLYPIALPSVPFFPPSSRSASPVGNISRSARLVIGQRRPSSALPHFGRTSWGVDDIPMEFPPVTDFFAPSQSSFQEDESAFPEANTSLFEETFNFGFPAGPREPAATTFNDMFSNVAPHVASAPQPSYDLVSMDYVPPQELSLSLDCITAAQFDLAQHGVLTGDTASWANTPPIDSGPSSTYSGSPARSELSLPVIAPRPQHAPAGVTFDLWHDHVNVSMQQDKPSHAQGLSVALATQHFSVDTDQQIHPELEMLFDPTFSGIHAF